jgi:beta-galactosidase
MWYCHKSKYDYAAHFKDHYKNDIRAMVAKDYNHPSVVFYSIGNEVSEPATKEGLDLAKEMISYLHELDNSRAVTAGINLMIVANASKGKQMYIPMAIRCPG